MFKRQGIGHVVKGVPYRVGNSLRGLKWMWILRFKRVDRDIQRTSDGHGVVCHWPAPGLHDKLRHAGIPAGRHVHSMTLAQALSLRSPDGYRIHTLEDDSKYCAKYRMKPIWEPKGEGLEDQAFWDHQVDVANSYGVRPGGYALPAHYAVLPYMRRAGISPVTKLKGR